MPRTLPWIFLAVLACLNTACNPSRESRGPEIPLESRITWEGKPPVQYFVDSGLSRGAMESGMRRRHTLLFDAGDGIQLVLNEYVEDIAAFHAFQKMATPEELREGFYQEKDTLVFFHGPFVGELRPTQNGPIPGYFLKERLAFHQEELFRRPLIFRSFPLFGQMPFSERIGSAEMLGIKGGGTLFQMSYQCHRDTARLFYGYGPFLIAPETWNLSWKGQTDTLAWSRGWIFTGLDELNQPLLFWFFKGRFLGVAGCYDVQLAREYAEKMKKMAYLFQKP